MAVPNGPAHIKQLGGSISPNATPCAFWQNDAAGRSSAAAAGGWYLSRTSLMAIPAHGRLGLQSNLTAVAVADVPSTSVYDTPLISIPDP
uniref:Uncharacterized protein n=1 Tax=Oryza meridionalis TaxID=40149 RepID=A0A0E0F4B5_9ORYZ